MPGNPSTATVLALATAAAVAAACTSSDPTKLDPPQAPLSSRARIDAKREIIAIRTGWVGVKEAHFRYQAPGFLVLPRIMMSSSWHPWLPVISYAVVTPRGTVLVDTGADPRVGDPEHMACDPRARFFYQRNLRFRAAEDELIDRQLPALGVPVEDVAAVVITHFHADHSGRMDAFPSARVVTGEGNWPTHVGAVPCTWPEGFAPDFPAFEDGPFGAFERSAILLGDPDLRLVPLPGHTPGHVGVLVRSGARYWLAAGDATFDSEETAAGDVAGVSQDVAEARASQDRIRQQLEGHDTVLLPAHDLGAFARLEASSTGS